MTQHIFINEEANDDEIRVYYAEPVFVAVADRSDFEEANSLEEAHLPGIYVLMGDNTRYVGQASLDIYTRLQSHNVNKEWWNKVVFFGREDGHLSKAQLDYLEKLLITNFDELGYDLDNSTIGNTSYINKLDRIQVNDMMGHVKDMADRVANVGLFAVSSSLSGSVPKLRGEITVEFDGENYMGRSFRKIFREIASSVVPERLDQLSSIFNDGRPDSVRIIGTEPNETEGGSVVTCPIPGSRYHIYANFPRMVLQQKIEQIAGLTGLPVSFHFPD